MLQTQWRTVGQRIGGGGGGAPSGKVCVVTSVSGIMRQNIWGARNLCEGAKRPSPRERSDRAGGGSFFIFRLENVQSGAYLRRKYRLDDMYYIIITCMELKISHGLIYLGGGGKRPQAPHQYASD